MHYYFINAKTIYTTPKSVINMGNRDLSISMHSAHTQILVRPNTSNYCHSYSINCENTRETNHIECMNSYSIWIELNPIESHWILFYAQTHALTLRITINYRSNWISFNCWTNVSHTRVKKKWWSLRFIIFRWLVGWLTGWLHLYNLSAFVAANSHIHSGSEEEKYVRAFIFGKFLFNFFIMKIAFWIARLAHAHTLRHRQHNLRWTAARNQM